MRRKMAAGREAWRLRNSTAVMRLTAGIRTAAKRALT
jgi:hypothetical protein